MKKYLEKEKAIDTLARLYERCLLYTSYASRNVLVGILRGVPVKVPKDKTHDE